MSDGLGLRPRGTDEVENRTPLPLPAAEKGRSTRVVGRIVGLWDLEMGPELFSLPVENLLSGIGIGVRGLKDLMAVVAEEDLAPATAPDRSLGRRVDVADIDGFSFFFFFGEIKMKMAQIN